MVPACGPLKKQADAFRKDDSLLEPSAGALGIALTARGAADEDEL